MTEVAFPSPVLAWITFALLMLGLSLASYIDSRTLQIPKAISIGLLFGGLFMSAVRGAWFGMHGQTVWLVANPGPFVGALDAVLLAVASGVLAFLAFLILWLLGVCGGGDVKLFTALSTWLTPVLSLVILALSFALVCMWLFLVLVYRIAKAPVNSSNQRNRTVTNPGSIRGTRVSYSLPLTISTAIVVLVAWRGSLISTRPSNPPEFDRNLSKPAQNSVHRQS